jgi:hypothetical protein
MEVQQLLAQFCRGTLAKLKQWDIHESLASKEKTLIEECGCFLLANARHLIRALKALQTHVEKSRMPTLDCAICSKSITLEECKIDERGRAVHYQCLADKMERQESETNPKPN